MQMAVALAGFSMGEADTLRKAMGKKKLECSMPFKEKFIAGAVDKGYPRTLADDLFDMIVPFADYGFNASHACAYGYVAYQTAYLMAHHPVEYMAAILTSVKDDKDRKPYYLYACRGMGIEVLPPDVNESEMDFAPAPGGVPAIRYGLSAVRNVGEGAVTKILEARRADGAFTSFSDFCRKVDPGVLTKRVLESLIAGGRVRLARLHAPGPPAGSGQGLGADPRRAQGRGGRPVLAVRRGRRHVGGGSDRRVRARGRGVRQAHAPSAREGDARTVRHRPPPARGPRRALGEVLARDRRPRGPRRRRPRHDRRHHRRRRPQVHEARRALRAVPARGPRGRRRRRGVPERVRGRARHDRDRPHRARGRAASTCAGASCRSARTRCGSPTSAARRRSPRCPMRSSSTCPPRPARPRSSPSSRISSRPIPAAPPSGCGSCPRAA